MALNPSVLHDMGGASQAHMACSRRRWGAAPQPPAAIGKWVACWAAVVPFADEPLVPTTNDRREYCGRLQSLSYQGRALLAGPPSRQRQRTWQRMKTSSCSFWPPSRATSPLHLRRSFRECLPVRPRFGPFRLTLYRYDGCAKVLRISLPISISELREGFPHSAPNLA
ncbi:hypothetical protein K505DRAFT_66553 [Melanomma pulvis-pyrius CBS 109.77]|uniref:Uncharacterized protein n=1 Tax=Melanomma pulvis-pyrius CBS 109.77 TaxID=1314802 RepID=A0A6A6X5E6_9PLEO|nr:hypothetical protein K505DRAFT_66553 [Melanomma pulvis-pyrius CBS 109.77]